MSDINQERGKVVLWVFLAVVIIFVIRLFYLQIIDKDYKQFAENNALRKETIFPPRGIIYDRHLKPLVANEIIYDVMATPSKIVNLDTLDFSKLLDVPIDELRESFKKAIAFSPYKPSAIVKRISPLHYGRLQEKMFLYKGFFVQSRAARAYPHPVAAHVLGYLSEVNDRDIENAEGYYNMGDYIGKTGLEKYYEANLRGVKGIKNVLVDVLNREQGSYLNGKYDVKAIAGKDLITGLDAKLQEYGEKLLQGKKGAIVCIEPATGEILAMISTPSYDPNLLLGRERGKNFLALISDPYKPMFNRAISAVYPPGSTLKPPQALIALQNRLIRPSTTYSCDGGYHLTATQTIHCHAPGTWNLMESIQWSCNTYYCNVFKLIIDQRKFHGATATGLEFWKSGLANFGLGVKTGIDLSSESRGIVPSSKFFNKVYGPRGWRSSTVISLGIGQAEISLTPLQLANMAATIGNTGYYITPHLVRKIEDHASSQTLHWNRFETGIDTSYFGVIQQAMQDVIDHGTGFYAKIPGVAYCGKTGTSQNPHGEDHSLFIGFAPRKNPKIAIAVVIENAGFGGIWAAPTASLMVETYLNDSTSRHDLEKRIIEAKFDEIKVDVPD